MGKLIGLILGFFIFGPVGSIIGMAIGHFYFDAGTRKKSTFFGTSYREAQSLFFDNLFGMLAKLAKADGTVTRDEIIAINNIMTIHLRMDESSRQRAVEIFRKAKNSSHTFDGYAMEMARVFKGNRQVMHTVLSILFSVAAADGKISPEEETMLRRASVLFDLGPGIYDHMKAQYVKEVPLDRYYGILESSADDSNETIKTNYRRLVKEYHPDKVQAKGLPAEFQTFAKEKFQEIQNAYEEISKNRNI